MKKKKAIMRGTIDLFTSIFCADILEINNYRNLVKSST